jgi:hypothetical protein
MDLPQSRPHGARQCMQYVSIDYFDVFNVDLLPPVVAMHACIVLGLCEHDIPTTCDVESRR